MVFQEGQDTNGIKRRTIPISTKNVTEGAGNRRILNLCHVGYTLRIVCRLLRHTDIAAHAR